MSHLAISGEGLPAYATPSLAYYTHVTVKNPAVCRDKFLNQQFAAQSCSPRDDESSH